MSSQLTPMDVEKQEFARRLNGYDREEVRLFLRSLATEIERMNLEHGRLLEDNGRNRTDLEGLRSREHTLQQTLLTAQGLVEEVKDRARRESELIVKEARLEAERILQSARDQVARLEVEAERARAERDGYEARLRGVIEQHLEMLELRRDARGERDNLRVLPRKSGTDAG